MNQIEFTAEQIREVWKSLFGAEVPIELTTKQVYEACLSEIGSEHLRDELQQRRKAG